MTKINTSYWAKPGPNHDFDWSAVDENYDGAHDSGSRHTIGYGRTEQEAIDDLKRLYAEMADCAEADAEEQR